MFRLISTAALALTSVSCWNIGGRSPVTDLSTDHIQNAALFAVTTGKETLKLPEGDYTVGGPDCQCESCACLLSATKQVVAGMNWVIVLKVVPADKTDVQYRKVTIFDQSFAGGDDKYTVKKSETMSESEAMKAATNKITQSALDALSDANAMSQHTAGDGDGGDTETEVNGDPTTAAYMDKLRSHTSGLVQHVTFTPDGCATAMKVKEGDVVSMHYTGTLPDGKKFDSSYDRGTPFDFTVGAKQVIEGWEKAVPGMCIGEKSKLYIPSAMAYGDHGFGEVIPPKSNLIFDVEVMNIKRD
jgi:FKBP-type peptidyl-prolyl cis-trans isomerase